LLHQSELSIVKLGKLTHFSEITAQQGEVVTLIEATQFTQFIGSSFIVKSCYHGIARIRRHSNQAPRFKHLRCLFKQSRLGIFWMNNE
jgi:hypothetical protein